MLHCTCLYYYFADVIEAVTSPEYSTPQPFAGRPGSREQSRKKRVGRPRTPGGASISAYYSCSSADISLNYGEWRHSSCSLNIVLFPCRPRTRTFGVWERDYSGQCWYCSGCTCFTVAWRWGEVLSLHQKAAYRKLSLPNSHVSGIKFN